MACLPACVRETQARQGRIGGSCCYCSLTESCLLFMTPWTTAHQASLFLTTSWSSPRFVSIESVMPSNHLIFCCPLLLLPSVFPRIRVFSDELALSIRWPKYIFNFKQNYFQEIKSLCMVRLAPKELHGDKIFKQMPWKQRFFELPGALIQKFQFFSTAQFFKCHFASSLSLDSSTQHSVILGVY